MKTIEIQPSDIVELNSGSTPMTVIFINKGIATVEYDGNDGKLYSMKLPIACIKLFELCK